jgi:transcriptional regulator with XRE-family HTH domain
MIQSRTALGMSQESLGDKVIASRKTVGRWESGRSQPSQDKLAQIVAMLLPVDAALATELASSAGESIDSLGAALSKLDENVSPRLGTRVELLIDAIVCAGADASDVSPKAIRPALLAAFQRAKLAGLGVDAVVAGLSPKAPRPSSRVG